MKIRTNRTFHLVLFMVILTLLSFTVDNSRLKDDKFVVVLDAGHGGKDSGTPGTKRYKTAEKDIALDVTLALGKLINKNLPHVEVLYTRTKDVYPTLKGRSVLANEKEADLFISIHCNAQPKGKGTAYGSETFVLGLHKNDANLEVAKRENSVIFLEENYEETYKGFDPDSPESMIGLILAQEEYLDHSIELADYIESEFKVTAKRKSRGVKQAGLYVLAYTYMPSVLVELGFLTNKKEEDYLNSKKGKEAMAKSLFNAVEKYVSLRNESQNIDILNSSETNEIDKQKVDDHEPLIFEDITFRVQIAASSRKLETKPFNFKGLEDVSRKKSGSVYKYFYGQTSDYKKIKSFQASAKEIGFESCFIVAYKNGERISLKEALKTPVN